MVDKIVELLQAMGSPEWLIGLIVGLAFGVPITWKWAAWRVQSLKAERANLNVVVYSVRMAGRPECVSGLLPHFAQGKAACASQVGFARELSFVGTFSWTLLTVRCRRDWHDFVENGLGGRLQLHFLQQLGEATFARLPPAGNLCHDTGEREFWQVQT